MNLMESINRMRRLSGLNEAVEPITELNQEENQIVNDILNGLSEGTESILDKVKAYAKKGLLTASIVAALMAAPSVGQAQKQQIKQIANTSISQTQNQQVREVSPEEQAQWNQFLDFVESKGFKGSTELDVKNKNLGQSLFNAFKEANPDITITYDIVPSIQTAIRKIQQYNIDFLKRKNKPVSDEMLNGVSKVDGWFGSKTSQYKFPTSVMKTYHNGDLVSSKDLGFVKSDGSTTGPTASTQAQAQTAGSIPANIRAPKGAELFQAKDGKWYYENAQTGYIELAKGQ